MVIEIAKEAVERVNKMTLEEQKAELKKLKVKNDSRTKHSINKWEE